jgi:hypothetical protein
MMDAKKTVDELRAEFLSKLRDAEQAAYAYFCECDVGSERCAAHDMYEEIRTMTRRHMV